jgi:hypothetical protein
VTGQARLCRLKISGLNGRMPVFANIVDAQALLTAIA